MPLWEEVTRSGELVIAFGGLSLKNTQVNHGGVGRHGVREEQRAAARAGVKFINIGPLRDDAADFLHARWIAPRPNTDTAFMLGMAHTLLEEDAHDREFLERCCTGFEVFRRYLTGEADGTRRDAAWAAEITGVCSSTIKEMARLVASHRTVIAVSWSLQRAHHGEQPYWAAVALAAMSGSMGRPGGGFAAGYGTEDSVGRRRQRWPIAALPQPFNAVTTFIPVARVADMLLHPGREIDYDGKRIRYPDVRLVYWCGGNPFHHHQDLNRLVRAWQHPETVIVHDSWWTPVARFADIVVPVATMLERNDFAGSPVDLWMSAMHKAVEPPAGVLTDYDVFAAVSERLGFAKEFTEGRSADEWIRHLYECTGERLAEEGVELPDFDDFWLNRPSSSCPRRRPRRRRASPSCAPIRLQARSRRRQAGSRSFRTWWPASATTTARGIPPGSSRQNGSGRRWRSSFRFT